MPTKKKDKKPHWGDILTYCPNPSDVNIFKKDAQHKNLLEYIATNRELSESQHRYIDSLLTHNRDRCIRAINGVNSTTDLLETAMECSNFDTFGTMFNWAIDNNCLPRSWLVLITKHFTDDMAHNLIVRCEDSAKRLVNTPINDTLPLFAAYIGGMKKTIDILMHLGADLHLALSERHVLSEAISQNLLTVEFLLTVLPTNTIHMFDKSGTNPLHFAIMNLNVEAVSAILSTTACSFELDNEGYNALHILAVQPTEDDQAVLYQISIAKLLLLAGIDPNVTDKEDNNAAMLALKHNNITLTHTLLPHTNLFHTNKQHEHLAFLAIEHNKVPLFSDILDSTVHTTNPPYDMLYHALHVPKSVHNKMCDHQVSTRSIDKVSLLSLSIVLSTMRFIYTNIDTFSAIIIEHYRKSILLRGESFEDDPLSIAVHNSQYNYAINILVYGMAPISSQALNAICSGYKQDLKHIQKAKKLSLNIYNAEDVLQTPLQKIAQVYKLMPATITSSNNEMQNEIMSLEPNKTPLEWITKNWDTLSDLYLARCIAHGGDTKSPYHNAAPKIIHLVQAKKLTPYLFLTDNIIAQDLISSGSMNITDAFFVTNNELINDLNINRSTGKSNAAEYKHDDNMLLQMKNHLISYMPATVLNQEEMAKMSLWDLYIYLLNERLFEKFIQSINIHTANISISLYALQHVSCANTRERIWQYLINIEYLANHISCIPYNALCEPLSTKCLVDITLAILTCPAIDDVNKAFLHYQTLTILSEPSVKHTEHLKRYLESNKAQSMHHSEHNRHIVPRILKYCAWHDNDLNTDNIISILRSLMAAIDNKDILNELFYTSNITQEDYQSMLNCVKRYTTLLGEAECALLARYNHHTILAFSKCTVPRKAADMINGYKNGNNEVALQKSLTLLEQNKEAYKMLEDRYAYLECTFNSTLAKLSTTESDVAAQEVTISNLNESSNTLQQKLQTTTQVLSTTTEALANLKQDTDEKESVYQKQLSKQQQKVIEQKSLIDTQRKQIDELEKSIKLQHNYHQKNTEKLTTEHTSLQQEVTQLQSLKSQLTAAQEQYITDNGDMKQQIQQLEEKLLLVNNEYSKQQSLHEQHISNLQAQLATEQEKRTSAQRASAQQTNILVESGFFSTQPTKNKHLIYAQDSLRFYPQIAYYLGRIRDITKHLIDKNTLNILLSGTIATELARLACYQLQDCTDCLRYLEEFREDIDITIITDKPGRMKKDIMRKLHNVDITDTKKGIYLHDQASGLEIDIFIGRYIRAEKSSNINWQWEPEKNDWAFDTQLPLEKNNYLTGTLACMSNTIDIPTFYYTLHQLVKHVAVGKSTNTLYNYLARNHSKPTADIDVFSLLQNFEYTTYWSTALAIIVHSEYINHNGIQLSILNLLLPREAQPITMHMLSASNILTSTSVNELLFNIKLLWSCHEIDQRLLNSNTCIHWAKIEPRYTQPAPKY